MVTNLPNFVHSYLTWAVARAAALTPPVTWTYGTGTLRTLWRNEILERTNTGSTAINSADPAAVVMTAGGSNDRNTPVAIARLQLAAYGSGNDATMQLAQQLFELMALDSVGRELRQQQIPGFAAIDNSATNAWMILGVVVLNRPSQVGRDERNRVKIVSNLEVSTYPMEQSS